jgi:hypothetical protein
LRRRVVSVGLVAAERRDRLGGEGVPLVSLPKASVFRSDGNITSAATPLFWVEVPPGRKKSAVVIFRAPRPGRSGKTLWTVPFPKV